MRTPAHIKPAIFCGQIHGFLILIAVFSAINLFFYLLLFVLPAQTGKRPNLIHIVNNIIYIIFKERGLLFIYCSIITRIFSFLIKQTNHYEENRN